MLVIEQSIYWEQTIHYERLSLKSLLGADLPYWMAQVELIPQRNVLWTRAII